MEPLKFTEDELEGMSRKDLQAHAKDHGLKANAKNSVLIEQLRALCLVRASAEPKKEAANEEAPKEEVMDVEEKPVKEKAKPAAKKGGRGKRAATTAVDEEKTTKQAKTAQEMKVEAAQPDEPRTPPKEFKAEPHKQEFLSPLLSTKKLAHAARTFLTPVKNTPGKALITPRALKPAQGKILPKSPLLFSFDAQPAAKKSSVSLDERAAIHARLVSAQGTVLPVSSIDLFTVGVQTAPRLISAGALSFVSYILRRLLVNLCSYALLQSEKRGALTFPDLSFALAEVFPEGEIHSQAIRESLSARDRFLKLKDAEDLDTTGKAGLTLHVEHTAAMLDQLALAAEDLFLIGLSAVLEYITAELFESCPAINVGDESYITYAVVLDSIKSDAELHNLLQDYINEEKALVEKREAEQQDAATKLLADLKKTKAWAKITPTDDEAIQAMEAKLKVKLPAQLKALLQNQNGNKNFGVDSVEGILAEHASSQGDLLSILEFFPLRNRGDGQVDCLDSLSGCVVRLTLPISSPGASPVVARSLGEYIDKCVAAKAAAPKVGDLTLIQVNTVATDVCNLFQEVIAAEPI